MPFIVAQGERKYCKRCKEFILPGESYTFNVDKWDFHENVTGCNEALNPKGWESVG